MPIIALPWLACWKISWETILQAKLTAPSAAGGDDYFLPDLCQGNTVLRLVLVTELFVLTMVLAGANIQEFSWEKFARISMFALWVVLCSVALLCKLEKALSQLSLYGAVIAVMAVILTVTAIFSVLVSWVMSGAGLQHVRAYFSPYDLVRHLLVSLVMSGVLLRYFYLHTQLRRQEKAELKSRIEALQSRIKPHFLFNSMNSIASLIATQPGAAEQAVEDLCELFRASLRESDKPVPLQVELELCRRYLAIETLRLGERLKVEWQVDNLPAQASIPLLTLQPVFENAVYHGVQPLPEGGLISASIAQEKEALLIKISNPLPKAGEKLTALDGHQIALTNIRDRLVAFYAEKASLEQWVEGERFTTLIRLPCKEGKD